MKYQTISLKQFYPAKGAIYYVAIATVIFSHMEITCYFHVWRYHVFTWYFIGVYIIMCYPCAIKCINIHVTIPATMVRWLRVCGRYVPFTENYTQTSWRCSRDAFFRIGVIQGFTSCMTERENFVSLAQAQTLPRWKRCQDFWLDVLAPHRQAPFAR